MCRAQREKVRVCAYGEVLSVHTRRVLATARTRNGQKEKKLRSAQDCTWIPDSGEVDNM